jgi:DNA-binding NtrC family response regulator
MVERDILVVEEDRQIREVLNQIFLACGYKCLLASDVEEGLKAFGRSRPDLIVTDLGMPMSAVEGTRSREAGIELLRLVRRVDPDAAVIVTSGAADTKTVIACLKLGAYAFIMKPVNFDELLITVERALEWRQLLIERREHQEAQGQRQDMRQRDVLIVEEDPKVRDLLRQILDAAGYNTLLAGDGREGLEAFRRSRPDLIVTDFRMPAMNGIELLKQVRQEDPEAAVIVESGAADVKLKIASLKLGAYAFLMKPILVDELLITAERALELRQLLIERRQRKEVA